MTIDIDSFSVWGVSIPRSSLTEEEQAYLAGLPDRLPTIRWVWTEMDRVWHDLGLDNRHPLEGQPIDRFYKHPIWLVNGVFSAADPVSARHRRVIGSFIASLAPSLVADFGGGFGELAIQISKAVPSAQVAIVEPFPREVARARLAKTPRVRFIPALSPQTYDVVVAQDVLEHVEGPVDLAIDLARSVRPGGVVIFANNFTPIIECHLPRTFHLRHTFRFVMGALGLRFLGRLPGAEHALVFEVPESLKISRARVVETTSLYARPIVDAAAALRRRFLQRGSPRMSTS